MVSIVIVSHSPELANGLLSLVDQMTQGKVKVAVAAGVDDPENPIGTDAIAVMTAIEDVYCDDGVVVLVDMGSAMLSTDMALELLGEEVASQVHVCAAPIVEGAISAAVAAAAGLGLSEVIDEAHSAIAAKYQLLDQGQKLPVPHVQKTAALQELDAATAILEFEWSVQNPHGIHARPASAIVSTISPFKVESWLSCNGKTSDARSINGIALLGVKCDDTVIYHVRGEEAEEARQAFADLAQNNFNEQISSLRTEGAPPSGSLQKRADLPEDGKISGIAASEGIAIAPIWHYQSQMVIPDQRDFLGYVQEWQKFEEARAQALKELTELTDKSAQTVSPSGAQIFVAHGQMLTDPAVEQKLESLVKEKRTVESAWYQLMDEMAQAYRDSSSAYMQERAKDVYDIGGRLMNILCGEQRAGIAVESPVILWARDLTPSDTALLNPQWIKGIILEEGGSTSHSAIIARALNIPAVVGVTDLYSKQLEGATVLVDGGRGEVLLSPTASQIYEAEQEIAQKVLQREHAQQFMVEKAVTRDGMRIEVCANIANVQEAFSAKENGAEGVGLVRSEFLFTKGQKAPSEESQAEMYSQIAAAFKQAPVVIRTLDIGGDKPLSFLQQGSEENPFLGCRGVRLCLQNSELFATQLRALLRARAECENIKVMLPMISTMEELIEAKALLQSCYQTLLAAEIPVAIPDIGIMIEVPSAVINAEQLVKQVQFLSIGTNDLTQYVMAADRGNDTVSHLVSALQPAVLKMIAMTVAAAKKRQIPVAVCGEMAGDSRLTELLIGLGIDELSMSSGRIADVKQKIREIDSGGAQLKASASINAETLEEVEKLL